MNPKEPITLPGKPPLHQWNRHTERRRRRMSVATITFQTTQPGPLGLAVLGALLSLADACTVHGAAAVAQRSQRDKEFWWRRIDGVVECTRRVVASYIHRVRP